MAKKPTTAPDTDEPTTARGRTTGRHKKASKVKPKAKGGRRGKGNKIETADGRTVEVTGNAVIVTGTLSEDEIAALDNGLKAGDGCKRCMGKGYIVQGDGHDEPFPVCCSKCQRFSTSEQAEAAYEADQAAAEKADAGKLVDEAPKSPAGEPVVLNTCGEQLREDADQEDEAVNLDWTLAERTRIADAFRTVERRRKIMESTAEAAKIAKKAFDTAVEQWHDITQVIVHGQPEVDETGQRNMFPSPAGTARTVGEWVEGGKGLKTGGAVGVTDDQIRHAISNICEATVWQNDLSRAGVSAKVAAALDRANIRKPGDLMLNAARLGVRWWKEMGLEESEARTLMHRCLSCVLNVNDDVMPSVAKMLGAKLTERIDTLHASDTAWSELIGVLLDDKALAALVPEQSRERFERAAGHLINGGIADIGSAAVLLVGEPQWWFTRFPGIEAEALDIEVFASALPLAAQEHARATLLGERKWPNSDEPEEDANDQESEN